MTGNEVAMWLMSSMVFTLTVILYLRVDIRDWGMSGFTLVLFGMSTLLLRWVLVTYGYDGNAEAMIVLWRVLILVGAPIALAGFISGLLKDPPPRAQVARRLVLLAIAVLVITLVFISL